MHTRPRVRRAPGLPCALLFEAQTKLQTSDKTMSRECGPISRRPHERGAVAWIERSEIREPRRLRFPDFTSFNPGYAALCYFSARQLYARLNPAAWASSSVQNQRSGFVVAG